MDELAYAVTLQNDAALAAMSRFLSSADEMTYRMEHMGRAADGTGGASDRMRAKVDGVHTSNLAAAKSTQGLFDRIAHLGSNIAAALPVFLAVSISLKAISQIGAGIKLAAEFEQTTIQFKTLTGSAEQAKQVISELSRMAIDTPFQEGDLQAAAKSMLAARVPAEALKGELMAMGNIASATGADIGRLSVVYAQVAGKGKLYAEELQQFVEQGAGELRQAVASSMGVTTAKLGEMMQDGKVGFSDLQRAIQSLAGEGGKWGGAMAEQSRTTIGLTSSLKDSISKVLRLLAQPINDGPLKAFLASAVDTATTATKVIEAAMAQGKVGETLKQTFILGAKLGVNALVDFVKTIPQRIESTLRVVAKAIAAALVGSFDVARDLLRSFDVGNLKFDTSEQKAFFASLLEGAEKATNAAKITGEAWEDAFQSMQKGGKAEKPAAKPGDWAKALDAKTEDKDKKKGSGSSDDDRKKRAQDMALSRDEMMGSLAILQAQISGENDLANSIERALRIRKEALDIARKTGASEADALRLARQKVDLERTAEVKKANDIPDADRKKKAADMAQSRNDVMGEIAMLKAQVRGNNSKADAIERAMRVQRDALAIMRQTGASEEEALKLAKQKADLEDRRDGKARHIGGVTGAKLMGRDSAPLAGGGLAEFNRLQMKTKGDPDMTPPPGYARGQDVPVHSGGLSRGSGPLSTRGTRFDVSKVNDVTRGVTTPIRENANNALTATTRAAKDAASPSQQTGDPSLDELKGIRAELARIRTA